jgi:hypothetical protein
MENKSKRWTCSFLSLEWLNHVFLPHVNALEGQKLLIVDGHSSHVHANFVGRLAGHGIDLAILPSHMSHITQPLNVSIFRPLKIFLTHSTMDHMRYNRGRIAKVNWCHGAKPISDRLLTQLHLVRLCSAKVGVCPIIKVKVWLWYPKSG